MTGANGHVCIRPGQYQPDIICILRPCSLTFWNSAYLYTFHGKVIKVGFVYVVLFL